VFFFFLVAMLIIVLLEHLLYSLCCHLLDVIKSNTVKQSYSHVMCHFSPIVIKY